ncbi:hypothetical protein HUU53_00110 [Candidatus Micrarchaeota archaeon]|nr:hypothetical protein [Candidatus Micrarchaeota archaeon]
MKKMTKKTTKHKKTTTKKVARKIIDAEKQWGMKLDRLLDEWKSHIHEQIKLHEKILNGKHSVKTLINETVKMEKKFIDKVRKI